MRLVYNFFDPILELLFLLLLRDDDLLDYFPMIMLLHLFLKTLLKFLPA